VAFLFALTLAVSDGQVHRNDDGLLSLPRPMQFSGLNNSSMASAGDGANATLLDNDDVVIPDLWVSDLFYRALANFTVSRVGSTACKRQTDIYVTNLRNYTHWAVKSELKLNRNNYSGIGVL